MSLDPGIRTAELIAELIDGGYERATEATIRAILRGSNSGVIKKRLAELKDEAIRLADDGKRLTTDNPVLRALFADMDDVLANNRALIANSGVELQETAVDAAMAINRQLALPGISDAQLAQLGVRWNSADPEVINELVGFVENPAWADELAKYGDDVAKVIREQAITGVANGWGPVRIANAITRRIQGLPSSGDVARVAGVSESQAVNMMRTLQMQSFRSAQTINRMQNADILDSQIRIAALDDRTCLACISLHGETLEINERIDDHHQGRCTSIPVVKGRPRSVQSGQEWWDGLSPSQQLGNRSGASVRSLQDGATTLPEFVLPYEDKVFGDMLRENSLKGVLGSGAKEFYN
jgi:hypothetical protein